MRVIHYHSDFTSKPLHSLVFDFGKSNTDKSFFRPDISSVRAFLGSATGSDKVGLYDFNDGKDTGETAMTLIRDKSLDVTEVDKLIADTKARLETDLNEQIKKKADSDKSASNKKMLDNIQKLADSALSDSVSSKD